MWCDSAEPDRIKMWRKAGYHAEPVVKEPGVSAQIDYLKQMRIHIHQVVQIQSKKYNNGSGERTRNPILLQMFR